MTLNECFGAFIAQRIDLSQGYIRELRMCARSFSAFTSIPVESIDAQTVIDWMAHLLHKQKHAATSVNNRRRQLLTLLRSVGREVGRVPILREVSAEPTGWTLAELRRLFAAAAKRGPWWHSLVMVVSYTGERIGACLDAKSSDWCEATATLTLKAAIRKDRRGRSYQLPPDAAALVVANLAAERGPRLWNWPHCRRHFFRQTRRLFESAGLQCEEAVGLWHKLRRTSGSLVEANGGDGARHLGHSRKVFEQRYRVRMLVPDSQTAILAPLFAQPMLSVYAG